jgi:hypothetical protein
MKVRARGVLVVAALTLGACSGESAAPATTVPETTASTSPTTTAPAPTPATTPTTAPPATTPPTTVPTTTPATVPPTVPATIPADLAQAQQDVIDATVAAWQAYLDATRRPTDEAALEQLAATNSGPTLDRRLQRVVEIAASGVASVENPATPASIDIYEQTVVIDVAAGTASVEYCRIGSDLGVEVGGNADGTDRIVVDEVNAYHERAELVFNAGRWTDNDGAQLQKFPGATSCGV